MDNKSGLTAGDRDHVFNAISAVCCNMSAFGADTRSPKLISKIRSSIHEVVFLTRAEVSQAERRVSGDNRSKRLAVERNDEMAYSGRDLSRVFGPSENMNLGYIRVTSGVVITLPSDPTKSASVQT